MPVIAPSAKRSRGRRARHNYSGHIPVATLRKGSDRRSVSSAPTERPAGWRKWAKKGTPNPLERRQAGGPTSIAAPALLRQFSPVVPAVPDRDRSDPVGSGPRSSQARSHRSACSARSPRTATSLAVALRTPLGAVRDLRVEVVHQSSILLVSWSRGNQVAPRSDQAFTSSSTPRCLSWVSSKLRCTWLLRLV
jgi:hypothetical protein